MTDIISHTGCVSRFSNNFGRSSYVNSVKIVFDTKLYISFSLTRKNIQFTIIMHFKTSTKASPVELTCYLILSAYLAIAFFREAKDPIYCKHSKLSDKQRRFHFRVPGSHQFPATSTVAFLRAF